MLRLLDKRTMRREAATHFEELKIGVQSMTQPVENLSGGQRQGVAVARASAVVRPPERFTFRADHPFVFLIRHAAGGSVLFLGRVERP